MGKTFLSTPITLPGSWNHQPRVKMVPGEFSVGVKLPVCVNLDIHLHLLPRLRLNGTTPPTHPIPSWLLQRQVRLYLTFIFSWVHFVFLVSVQNLSGLPPCQVSCNSLLSACPALWSRYLNMYLVFSTWSFKQASLLEYNRTYMFFQYLLSQ